LGIAWSGKQVRILPNRRPHQALNQDALNALRDGEAQPSFVRPQRSLLGEVLDWMLAPLFLLWPMSVAITYVVAQNIANVPYDQALANQLQVIARQVNVVDGRVRLTMTGEALKVLRDDPGNTIFWVVLGSQGEYIGGDRQLPVPRDSALAQPGNIRYENDSMRGTGLRLAYTSINALGPDAPPTLVVVAETTERRTELANDIIKGVIIPQFAVLPIAVLLVWLGLSRGIAPLSALQTRLRARRPDDLSPMDERAVPTEIAPLISAMNDLLLRQSATVEAQRRFVADAAHQLKTPLAGLRTQAELALRTAGPEEMQSSLRQLVVGSKRATRLVNQLLLLASAENPSTVALVPIDLNAIAYERCTLWTSQSLATGTDLGFEESAVPVMILGQSVLLAELINNLIDNALRYTPHSGTITIRVANGENAMLEVEDSGPGIPENERERVFDRFYRVLGTNSEGSGLGLAIVREIAQKHGASIELHDNPTVMSCSPGLRIRVIFPPYHVATDDSIANNGSTNSDEAGWA
jgi:two-component system sensor histidine kinase TctE